MSTGFRNGRIRLTDKSGVYYSGQVISGSVVFVLEQPLTFSVLSITYHGEADVLWTETETEVVNDMEREYTVNYVGHEDYFNYTENLIGGAGTSQLPAGSHAIPFQYRIPTLSPSSFKGEKGEIQYNITAVMTYMDPMPANDELYQSFQVVAPLDLNVGDPALRQPINLEFEEVYGCMCVCGARPVAVRARLPAAGFCPGQAVPVAIEVQNESNVEITKMYCEIVTREYYRSTEPASEFTSPESVLVTAKTGAVLPNSSCDFVCNLLVPDMIAPYLENCTIIDVRYFFRITIKVSGCNDAMQDESEIALGLVPIKEITDDDYYHPLADQLPNSPIPVISSPSPARRSPIQPQISSVNNFSPPQSIPYPNYGTPYPHPTNNPPYPADNNAQTQSQKTPFRDYEIGFKAPDTVVINNPPYPVNPVQNQIPPYPTDNRMPSSIPPYPTGNMMPQVNAPPLTNGSFTPSAPPP